MAVRVECINLLVRFDALAKVYPGGESALWDPQRTCGIHDGEIVRLGAMSDHALWQMGDWLESLGLKAGKDFGGFDLPGIELHPDYASGCVGLRGSKNQRIIGDDNFEEFLLGKVKAPTLRGTAIVQRDGKILLVKEKNDRSFSLPGGSLRKGEPALAAAVRELYEELGLCATKAERLYAADHTGPIRRHLVSRIDICDHAKIVLDRKELSDYLWWDGIENIELAPHVKDVLRSVYRNLHAT